MLKKLSILLLTIFVVVPALVQPEESCECMFAPKAGQWQIDLTLGQGQFYGNFGGQGNYFLLPNADGTSIGISQFTQDEQSKAHVSADLTNSVFNIGSLNWNSLANIVGLQARYFITDRFDINVMAAYNVNMQPSKDFIEGTNLGLGYLEQRHLDPSEVAATVNVGDIYAHKAVLGSVSNSLMTQLGTNFYFNVKNPRISPYIGLFGQFRMARIESYYPYTGEVVLADDNFGGTTGEGPQAGAEVDNNPSVGSGVKYDDIAIYRPEERLGQVLGFGVGIAAGVGYSISEGLILGFEVAPVSYQYSLMHMQLTAQSPYFVTNHNIRAFAFPQVKLGIRF